MPPTSNSLAPKPIPQPTTDIQRNTRISFKRQETLAIDVNGSNENKIGYR
jgi:hypothetical protein